MKERVGHLNGTVLHDLSHDLIDARDRVSRLTLVLIARVGGSTPGLVGALAGARGRVVLLGRARVLAARHVVIARREGIG